MDCITFGSPCQDLSIAGRRAGLAGERSGLFMEAVRIIKEMRSSTNGLYPTFAVWENVPGAFSSNGGEDFRAVLEELARVEQPDTSIPRPPKGATNAEQNAYGTRTIRAMAHTDWKKRTSKMNYKEISKKHDYSSSRMCGRKAVDVYKNGIFIKRCKSQKDASKETGVSVSQISCCAKGQKKSCKGYEFQRIEEFPMAVTKRRFGEE